MDTIEGLLMALVVFSFVVLPAALVAVRGRRVLRRSDDEESADVAEDVALC